MAVVIFLVTGLMLMIIVYTWRKYHCAAFPRLFQRRLHLDNDETVEVNVEPVDVHLAFSEYTE